MITPVLFILFPLAVGVALMPLARKPKASVAIVCVASMLLAALALFMPDDLVIQFAGRRFVFSETLSVLGRQLTVGPEDLTLLAWLFVQRRKPSDTAAILFSSGSEGAPR